MNTRFFFSLFLFERSVDYICSSRLKSQFYFNGYIEIFFIFLPNKNCFKYLEIVSNPLINHL